MEILMAWIMGVILAGLLVYLVYLALYCLVKRTVRAALREHEAERDAALTASRGEAPASTPTEGEKPKS